MPTNGEANGPILIPQELEDFQGADKRGPAMEQQHETDEIIARMFDGEITLVAAIRCGTHCGTVLHLYPGIEQKGEPMTRALAKDYAEQHEWKRRVRSGEHMWLCPKCQ